MQQTFKLDRICLFLLGETNFFILSIGRFPGLRFAVVHVKLILLPVGRSCLSHKTQFFSQYLNIFLETFDREALSFPRNVLGFFLRKGV